ncbi:MAG: FAD-binding oxidoreductase [Flammeovirgaceae bacterium]
MSDYYTLKIKDVIKETDDAVTIQFKQPLFKKVKYLPGQFLTVIIPINGEKLRRSYSMSSAPNLDSHLAVTVKRVEGGIVSNYLNEQVKKGDSMEIMKPMGNFTLEPNKKGQRHVILFGGGSGITPLMSILKSALYFEPKTTVSLVYANHDENCIIFKQELEALKNKFGERLNVIHVLSQPKQMWNGHTGRMDEAMVMNIHNLLPKVDAPAEYYICGPEGMMDIVQEALSNLKIKDSAIHTESFVSSSNGESDVDTSAFQTHTVTIHLHGDEHKVIVPPDKTILDAGLDAGLDMPFSCQSGLCTACMGKCVSGEVKMTEEDTLSPDEVAEGYRLLCVGHPASEDVIIEM